MQGIRKVSPSLFLMNNKWSWGDYTPQNYFDRFRFELFLNRMIFWFFQQYGIYFLITKLKLRDKEVLLHFFYYKTFMEMEGRRRFRVQNKAVVLLGQVAGLKVAKPFLKAVQLSALELIKVYWKKKRHKIGAIMHTTSEKRARLPFFKYLLFFHYFFLQWWGYKTIVLAKPLLPIVQSVPKLQEEMSFILWRAEYLLSYNWAFDFLFFLHCTLFFCNTNFLFPFLVVHLLTAFKHLKYILLFINLLERLYAIKENVQGVKLLIRGPYDRHGRTRLYYHTIGYIILTSYDTQVVYDMIHCPTMYGMLSLKFWIYYCRENFLSLQV